MKTEPPAASPAPPDPVVQTGADATEAAPAAAPPPRHLAGAAILSGLTFGSRLLGAARDVFFARYFFGAPLDAFGLAWMVPNLSRQLFGEGALSSAFIPVFVEKLEQGDRPAAFRLARQIATLLFFVLGAVALIGALIALGLSLGLGAGSFAGNTCRLLAFSLPYMPLICLAALYMGMLNAFRRFAAPALGPILLNLCFILAAWQFRRFFGRTREEQVLVLALAGLVGGLLQLLVQLPGARAEGFTRPFVRPALTPEVRRVLAAFGGAAFGLAAFQINVLVDRLLAETLIPGDGAVSTLYLASHLIQLPLGVFAVSIAAATFPELARAAARQDGPGLLRTLGDSLRSTLFVAVPAALGLALLAEPIVLLLYGHGQAADPRFGAVARTTATVVAYTPAIVGFAVLALLARTCYARGDTRTPAWTAAASVLLNLLLNLTLIGPLHEVGLALASSVSVFFQVAVLAVLILRREAGLPTLASLTAALLAAGGALAAALGLRAGALRWLVHRGGDYLEQHVPWAEPLTRTELDQAWENYGLARAEFLERILPTLLAGIFFMLFFFLLLRLFLGRRPPAPAADAAMSVPGPGWLARFILLAAGVTLTGKLLWQLLGRLDGVAALNAAPAGARWSYLFLGPLVVLLAALLPLGWAFRRRREADRGGLPELREARAAARELAGAVSGALLRVGLIAAGMTLVVHWSLWSLPPPPHTAGWTGFVEKLQRVVAPTLAGLIAFWFLASLFPVREYEEVRELFRRRRGGGRARAAKADGEKEKSDVSG